MKKFFMLLLLVVFNSGNASEQEAFYNENNPIPMEVLDSWDSIEEIIMYFKRYGLFYCINTFNKTDNVDLITEGMLFYKIRLRHPDGSETKQKSLEKYINDMLDSIAIPPVDLDGRKIHAVVCLSIYESKAYMQEIDKILRPYYLDPVFPKEYQERYKKTIERFLKN